MKKPTQKRNLHKFFLFFLIFFVFISFSYAEEVCSVNEPDCVSSTDPSLYNALSNNSNTAIHDENSICIVYFYGDGCPNCAKIKPYLEEIQDKYKEKIHFQEYEIYNNLKNYQLYNQYCGIQRIPLEKRGVPLLAINDKFFMGSTQIRDNLEQEIESMLESGTRLCPLPNEMGCHNIDTSENSDPSIEHLENTKITLPLILGAGLVDGVNPCAFAVLIFLLTFLLEVSSNKRRMIKAGAAYTFSVYLSYLLAGLGLFSVIQLSGMSRVVVTAAAVLAIAAGLVNVKDYFWYGKGFSLKIPESKRETIKKWTYKANVPAALVLGFLVSMFELPCTGGVYLAIIALLADSVTRLTAIYYLLIYNLMFILPLIVIIAALTWGMKAEHIANWRESKKNWMKLAMGLLLIVLGAGMLLGWF
ncbi:hypothetical protein KY330_05025 [Candidatus Woesearchaeota archaeon]|nr:hypothetical protein [Candidatus Woesearchaeota archaeon]